MHKQGSNPDKKTEILSPAGDLESVRAAVLNGANAVYLGEKSFSARQNAKNFDGEELICAVSYCHARGVLVYLTLNTLVFDSQLEKMAQAIKAAALSGVDAFIIQDLAVFEMARQICPDMPLHASTQMSITSVEGARQLADLGFSRVVLARELSLEQIKAITSQGIIETEVFVHGALCMSVSGQCYISGMLMERSGNRGSCAGICRLPFTTTQRQSYDLSLKDLCLAEHIKELEECGVASLKIEGRMKRPEYVAAATKAYANAQAELNYDMDGLRAIFSRSGFTDGYLKNAPTGDMFGYRQKEDVTAATSSLLKEYANTYHKEKGIIPLSLKLTAKKDNPLKLIAFDEDKNSAECIGDPPPKALNRQTTKEDVEKALSKLGGTIFYPHNIECEIEDGLFISAATINELRREACESILKQREKALIHPLYEPLISIDSKKRSQVKNEGFIIRYQAFEQLDEYVVENSKLFSLPIRELEKNADKLIKYKDKLIIEPSRVAFSDKDEKAEAQALKKLSQQGFTRLLANNLSHISIGRTLKLAIYGGPFLNCTNSIALDLLSKMGVCLQTLSFETPLKELSALSCDIPLSVICYGYLPLMLLKTCPMKNQLGCSSCTKALKDRKGKEFKLICNENDKKYTELLNCNPLILSDRLNELNCFEYKTFYFTLESKEECRRIFESYIEQATPIGEFTRGLYYRSI